MSSKQLSIILLPAIAMLALTLTLSIDASEPAGHESGRIDSQASNPFPSAEPASVGVSPEALRRLTDEMQSMVDDQEIVGGELLVIKNRRTVLREAFGWKDREAKERMAVDAVYCVRSMTKPFVGTAIQMLIDEGNLSLDTPVYTILPSFDGPKTREITIEHLLTHTSGLPFTTFKRSLTDYADLAAVADEAAEAELLFAPGSRFAYSDAGSDTLGAIVAAISGMPVEQFIQQRILDPLGMNETVALLQDGSGIKGRVPSAYSGGTGSWLKHWSPEDPSIFPIFLTSQSLYSTTTDYAKFLAWWMDGGVLDGRRLLSPEAVERALSPSHGLSGHPNATEGVEMFYGQQWMVEARTDATGEPRLVMFGHDGSDGTHAWAWPDEDLIVLFFTQSRGTLSGVGLEKNVQTLLVDQRLDDPNSTRPDSDAGASGSVAGLYWDEDVEHAYYVVTSRGDHLEIDRPGGGHMVFKAGAQPGRFVHEANRKVWVEFVRSEAGDVTAMRTFFGKRAELDPRHVPQDGLPSVDELVALVMHAHGIDKLSGLGVVELRGTTRFVDRGARGSITSSFDMTRSRNELTIGSSHQTVMIDGDRVWSVTPTSGLEEATGRLREQELLGSIPVLLGDWTDYYERVEVLKRIVHDGRTLVLVRLVPAEGTGSTVFVDEATGLVFRKDDLVQVPGVGIVGVQTLFEDYRDVGGMKIAFRVKSKYQNKLIGRISVEFDHARTGVEVAADAFAPRSAR